VVVGGDGLADVVVDEVGVDGDRGGGSGAGGGDDLGARVDDVPSGPDTGDAGPAGGVGDDPAVLVGGASQAGEELASRGTTEPSAMQTPRRRSPSMTRLSMVPSTTPMARATSPARSAAVSCPGGVKYTRSWVHCRTIWA
jgi:hypothetical protein